MGKFEDRWKEAFDGTEVAPSDSVWMNIDRDLAYAEGATMKKRVELFQRVAAASILFALLMGSFGVYHWRESNRQLAQHLEQKKTLENNSTLKENEKKIIDKKDQTANSAVLEHKEGLTALNQKMESGKVNSLESEKPLRATNETGRNSHTSNSTRDNVNGLQEILSTPDSNQPIASVREESKDGKKVLPEKEWKFSEITFSELGLLPIPEIHHGPVIAEIVRKLPAIPAAFMEKKENKINHEHLWASVTAAAGSYNPNTNSNYSYNYATSASASNSASVTGTSYSFGMLAGMRVTRRVVLQSGVQYMNQSIGSVSNINSSGGSLAGVANYSANPSSSIYNTTTPYGIVSANEFVSVPLQAGYLFVDRKIGLQLNSGVATDFFIRNTLSDPSGQRQSYSQAAGQDSPYRSINFSGLMSSELSYKLGSRYRVSLVPGFRYSFSPVLKSTSNSAGNPWVWDVGFRFRYIFK